MPRRNVQEIKAKSFRWINIPQIGRTEAEYLRENFSFEALDINACLPPLQRPNLFARERYLFIILLFPYYDRKARVIKSAEVDFFITKDSLVTVHSSELLPLAHFWDRTQKFGLGEFKSAGELLHKIIDRLIQECFPMLAHISNDIDEVEKKMSQVFEREIISEILRIKTNIVNFRKTIQGHKAVLRKLMREGGRFADIKKLELYFDYLVEETKEIWEELDGYKSTIDALHEANDSLINFRTGDIMRTLTIFSVIIFVLTLIVSLFNLNTIDNPLSAQPSGFKIIIGAMLVAIAGLLVFFKRKKWF
jgi:magnesium transporter